MTDIGMMQDDESIAKAMSLARRSLDLLCAPNTTVPQPTSEVKLYILEEASFHFHQLSTLIDAVVAQRLAAARPQEEAHAQGVSDSRPD